MAGLPRRRPRSTARSACSASVSARRRTNCPSRFASERSRISVSRSSACASFRRTSSAGRREPATFDVFSCFAQDMAEFWATGNLQPLETARMQRWKEHHTALQVGKALPGGAACTYGQGDAAFRRLYVDPDRSGRWRSARGRAAGVAAKLFVEWVEREDRQTGRAGAEVGHRPARHCFNFDSFGYNARVLGKRPEQLSWAELLNSRWRTTRRSQRLRPAGQASGRGKCRPGGRPDEDPRSRRSDEEERSTDSSRYCSCTGSGGSSSISGGRAAIWSNGCRPRRSSSPRCRRLRSRTLVGARVPIRQAAPREGYRAFAGLLPSRRRLRDPATLDACYRYLNWWHRGSPASVLRYGLSTAQSRRRAGGS